MGSLIGWAGTDEKRKKVRLVAGLEVTEKES